MEDLGDYGETYEPEYMNVIQPVTLEDTIEHDAVAYVATYETAHEVKLAAPYDGPYKSTHDNIAFDSSEILVNNPPVQNPPVQDPPVESKNINQLNLPLAYISDTTSRDVSLASSQNALLQKSALHDYQQFCVDFILSHPVALLILEMGLGKTIITLTALCELYFRHTNGICKSYSYNHCKESTATTISATNTVSTTRNATKILRITKCLIIAPLRVARDTWPQEIGKWEHLKDMKLSVMVGTEKVRIAALNTSAHAYVINRENVRWLVEYYEKQRKRWDFDCIVIDELSSFKNSQSQRYKYLKKIRPFVKRFIGLTGTPASNGLLDLWAEVSILDGGIRLGKYFTEYRDSFFRPGAMHPVTGVVYDYIPLNGAEEAIYSRISDMAISMKALDHLDMPGLVFVDHTVDLSISERKLYDMLAKELIIPLNGGDIDASNSSILSGKLLQMANGAVYDEYHAIRPIHDRKLQMLEDLIESANGQPVLVSYWFKHDRIRILNFLAKSGYGSNRVRDLKTSVDIRDWNNGKIPIALIHPISAGHGLNIQAGGHILIWFSLPWSLELYQQTNARLWRQGQSHVVTVHHIIAKNTADEDVLQALELKDLTQERLISAVRSRFHISARR